jgi:hypothetical protein
MIGQREPGRPALPRRADEAFTGTSADTGKRVRIAGFEEWTIGADGLVGESLGHYDQAEYDRQHQHGVDG